MSRTRSNCSISAVCDVMGVSSTSSRIVVPSGTGWIVWPVVAKPNAVSGYWIGHVSWNPLSNVSGVSDGTPSSSAPRMPRYPFDSANSVSVCSTNSGLNDRSTSRHGSTG
jgi:hypothetical protein